MIAEEATQEKRDKIMEKKVVCNGVTVINETADFSDEEITEAATYIVDAVNALIVAIKKQKTA